MVKQRKGASQAKEFADKENCPPSEFCFVSEPSSSLHVANEEVPYDCFEIIQVKLDTSGTLV